MADEAAKNAAAASHHRKVLVMPEAFSAGENDDWHSWLKYFKNCATLNAWDDEQKRNFLAVRLHGIAQQTYQDLNETVQEGSFDGLAEALGRRFAPAERVELYKAEFYARKRVSGEKLGELAANVRKLAKKAFPGATNEIVDQLAKDRFIDALVDKDLRIRIREGSPAKLDDAVSRGIQLEAIHEAENNKTRLLDKVERSVSLHEVTETVVSANGRPLDVLGRCGVRLQLGGVDVIRPVLVAGDITQDCLVGIDFLSKYRCEISFRKEYS